MENISWLKQTKDQPLFPDLLWSRPENRRHAGKLLIVGGNSASFAAVSSAYAAAGEAGIGTARVMVPSSLERTLSSTFPEAEFAPSTPSGSFARTSLAPLCDAAAWSDGVLMAGGLGRNSETAILLEGFIRKYNGPLTLADDSLDYFAASQDVLDRPETILVGSVAQLQKILLSKVLIKQAMNLVQLVEALAGFTSTLRTGVATYYNGNIIVSSGGRLSTTRAEAADLVSLAAFLSVWSLQQPAQTFQALTTAVYCYSSYQE